MDTMALALLRRNRNLIREMPNEMLITVEIAKVRARFCPSCNYRLYPLAGPVSYEDKGWTDCMIPGIEEYDWTTIWNIFATWVPGMGRSKKDWYLEEGIRRGVRRMATVLISHSYLPRTCECNWHPLQLYCTEVLYDIVKMDDQQLVRTWKENMHGVWSRTPYVKARQMQDMAMKPPRAEGVDLDKVLRTTWGSMSESESSE